MNGKSATARGRAPTSVRAGEGLILAKFISAMPLSIDFLMISLKSMGPTASATRHSHSRIVCDSRAGSRTNGYPTGVDPNRCALIMSFTKDRQAWMKGRPVNVYDGRTRALALSRSVRRRVGCASFSSRTPRAGQSVAIWP
jgi:hypothetical protein